MPVSTNKEILVFGQGWIGKRLSEYLSCNSTTARINTYEDVQREIDQYQPKVIINCIGSFGKNVDDCEINKTKTMFAHVAVPILLAEAAIRNGIKLVHLSSGCIFHYDYKSNKALTELDQPDFFDLYYSRTKIYAESALCALGKTANILQVRMRMPLDYIPHPRNILDKAISFNSVINIPNSVTYIPDALDAIKHLIKIDAEGIYNVVNYGGLTLRELLEAYRKYNPNHGYSITSMSELKIKRTNILLNTEKLENSGYSVRDIHDILPECLEKYNNIVRNRVVPDAT